MKEKLFKILFPSKFNAIESLNQDLIDTIGQRDQALKALDEKPEANLADIMRENLALLPHSLFTGEKPMSPFDGLSEEQYATKVSELNFVFHNTAFNELMKYLVDMQFEYTMNKATIDSQIYAGRFNINGLALVQTNLNNYHNIYEEAIKPPDSYDPHEIINELNN